MVSVLYIKLDIYLQDVHDTTECMRRCRNLRYFIIGISRPTVDESRSRALIEDLSKHDVLQFYVFICDIKIICDMDFLRSFVKTIG